MRHWLVFRPACLTDSSPSSTLQLGRSPVSVARSILQMLSPVSTGFERPSASSLNWRSLCTELFTALHLSTYRASFSYVADLPSRRRGRLRSSTSSLLDIRLSQLVTVGDRTFAAVGPRLWNSLPVDVQSALSLTTFCQKLKTHLFRQSYSDIVF